MPTEKFIPRQNLFCSADVDSVKKLFKWYILALSAATYLALATRPVGLDLMMNISSAHKRTMYDFKNYFSTIPHFFIEQSILFRNRFCHRLRNLIWSWVGGMPQVSLHFRCRSKWNAHWGKWFPNIKCKADPSCNSWIEDSQHKWAEKLALDC